MSDGDDNVTDDEIARVLLADIHAKSGYYEEDGIGGRWRSAQSVEKRRREQADMHRELAPRLARALAAERAHSEAARNIAGSLKAIWFANNVVAYPEAPGIWRVCRPDGSFVWDVENERAHWVTRDAACDAAREEAASER